MAAPDIKRSEQRVLNDVHDEQYSALVVEASGFDGQSLRRPISDTTATRLDDTTTVNVIYIGKAPVGSSESSAVWQIAKLDTSSGLTKTWAGNANFTQIWGDRASLTYN